MKRNLLLWITIAVSFLTWAAPAQAQCPEDPNDHGICDTMYVEVYENDWLFTGQARQVRVPIRVTNDIPNPVTDSIAGFVIPLCFTTSNPSAQCYLDPMYNGLLGLDFCEHLHGESIFRHLPSMDDPQEHNWMMDLCHRYMRQEWDTSVLVISQGNNAWLSLVATGTQDQKFPGGSRVLVATLTFTVDDTMTICLDSCFWPPTGQLTFCRHDARLYVPRANLPYCFTMSYLGDCTGDRLINVSDAVFLLSYLFRYGPAPDPIEVGDTNCDGIVDIGDVLFLINYLYRGGAPPSCPQPEE
jgi:hypothetical protein